MFCDACVRHKRANCRSSSSEITTSAAARFSSKKTGNLGHDKAQLRADGSPGQDQQRQRDANSRTRPRHETAFGAAARERGP